MGKGCQHYPWLQSSQHCAGRQDAVASAVTGGLQDPRPSPNDFIKPQRGSSRTGKKFLTGARGALRHRGYPRHFADCRTRPSRTRSRTAKTQAASRVRVRECDFPVATSGRPGALRGGSGNALGVEKILAGPSAYAPHTAMAGGGQEIGDEVRYDRAGWYRRYREKINLRFAPQFR